jgi:hypothetical protein
MDALEYYNELEKLRNDYNVSVDNIKIKYALSNNTIKVGDIITDHVGSIKVSEINVATPFGSKLPCCLYNGVEYTIKGEPKKNGGVRDVWQCNLV